MDWSRDRKSAREIYSAPGLASCTPCAQSSERDEEMAFHRGQVEKEFIEGGMTPEAARYAATRQFGNAAKLRDESHDVVTICEYRTRDSSG